MGKLVRRDLEVMMVSNRHDELLALRKWLEYITRFIIPLEFAEFHEICPQDGLRFYSFNQIIEILLEWITGVFMGTHSEDGFRDMPFCFETLISYLQLVSLRFGESILESHTGDELAGKPLPSTFQFLMVKLMITNLENFKSSRN